MAAPSPKPKHPTNTKHLPSQSANNTKNLPKHLPLTISHGLSSIKTHTVKNPALLDEVEDRRRAPHNGIKWNSNNVFTGDRYVSFYVEGLPSTWTNQHLFKEVQKWEEIVDAFIPTRRNAKGLKFGFVRFLRSRDGEELRRRRLNAMVGAEYRITFNVARYSLRKNVRGVNGGVGFRRREFEGQRMKGIMEPLKRDPICLTKRSSDIHMKTRDDRTFAEVVVGSPRIERRLLAQTRQLNKVDIVPDWLGRSLIATLTVGYSNLSEIPDSIEIRPYGGDLFILTFPTVEEMEAILLLRSVKWISMFSDVHPWRGSECSRRRWAWLQIRGLPVIAWSPESFGKVVDQIGTLIKVDGLTANFSRLDAARICILTAESQTLQWKVAVCVEDTEYEVFINEETSWEPPFDCLKKGRVGSNVMISPICGSVAPNKKNVDLSLDGSGSKGRRTINEKVGPKRNLMGDLEAERRAPGPAVENDGAFISKDQSMEIDRTLIGLTEQEMNGRRVGFEEAQAHVANFNPSQSTFPVHEGQKCTDQSSTEDRSARVPVSAAAMSGSTTKDSCFRKNQRFKMLKESGSLASVSEKMGSTGSGGVDRVSQACSRESELQCVPETGEEIEELVAQAPNSVEERDLVQARWNYELLDQLGMAPKQDSSLIIQEFAEKIAAMRRSANSGAA